MNTELAREIASVSWHHAFEVLPGLKTPGKWPTNPGLIFDERYQLPRRLTGQKALDIGTLDGAYAFELERRGAEVTAIDIQDPDRTGFNIAKRILGSRVQYVRGSVYDLDKLLIDCFDIICFFGVFYHLKHPVLAFEQVNNRLKEDGCVLFEGECMLNHAEPGKYSELAQQLAKSEMPIAFYYPSKYKNDSSNWWIANPACIRAWLTTCALDLVSCGFHDQHPVQRMYGIARKTVDGQVHPDHGLI
jgi:SAM-dependent methyltransferase